MSEQQIKAEVKAWWRSWTIRINAALAALPMLIDQLQQQLPTMQQYIPTNLYGRLFVASVLLNLLLRIKTKQGIGLK